MNEREIMSVIERLATAQGFYSRLLRDIKRNPSILEYLVEQEFADSIDLIMFLEGG